MDSSAATARRNLQEVPELSPVGVSETREEVGVGLALPRRRAGLDGAERCTAVEADADAVAGTEDLRTDVVPPRVLTAAGEDRDHAVCHRDQGCRGIYVVVFFEHVELAHAPLGVHFFCLGPG